MRRSIVSLLVVSSAAFIAMGCEDGPAQPFNQSPNNAEWNNGNTPGFVSDVDGGFGDPSKAGTTKTEICNAPTKAKRWSALIKEPIKPPRYAGGLDLAGDDTWKGLTIDEAEKINCQSINAFTDGQEVYNYWGDNAELVMTYRLSTRRAIRFLIRPGYRGTLTAKSPDGKDTWTFPLVSQIQKNGKPFILDWVSEGGKNFIPAADEIFRALMATYAPGVPLDRDGVTCIETGRCIKGSFGDVAYLYIPALGVGLWVPNQFAAQPAPSILDRIDVYLNKLMPFALAQPLMKLDLEGPVAIAGKLGAASTPCVLKTGLTYNEFLNSCVKVTGDAAKDKVEENKLLGGYSHNRESFRFDISGTDLNFKNDNLLPDSVTTDDDKLEPTDHSIALGVDQATQGSILNDRDAKGEIDLHGAGAVYKEYARRVRTELLADAKIPDGDITQCLAPNPVPPGWDPEAFIAGLPPHCTGWEHFITGAAPLKPGDPNNLGVDVGKVNQDLLRGLKPGHIRATFCLDATGDVTKGYKYCNAPYGHTGDLILTSQEWTVKVFGKGKDSHIPIEARDLRFYWRHFMYTVFAYLTVGDKNPVPDLSKIVLNPDDLHFDEAGDQFETAEYIDRRYASKSLTPTDVVVIADIKNGIFNGYDFSRDLTRGERVLYQAVLEDQTHGLGQEYNALLTNIFGSPALKNGWHASRTKSAYECATADPPDPTNCEGQMPPLDSKGATLKDDLGRPLLKPYKGAFQETTLSIGPKSGLSITKTFAGTQSAKIRLPLYTDPYNLASAPLPALEMLVPWAPKQPGVGFGVAINGMVDKFIQASVLSLEGYAPGAEVYYDLGVGADGSPDGTLTIHAAAASAFLGEVFMCKDSSTGDLLAIRMYEPVIEIMDWLKRHPNAYTDCGVIVSYSPFGNFVHKITSLVNGVAIHATQGGGLGRIVDATLFIPGS